MSLEILKKYNIKAKKSLWQNFLVNESIVEEISTIFDLSWKNIIEVGPGYWALTEKLLNQKPSSLTLVELDKEMIDLLNIRLKKREFATDWVDFKIENIDVLEYIVAYKEYYLIANIPYYITSPILRHFLYDIENKPEKMLILMQKDVWDKILWKQKNKSSVLSLFIEKKCSAREVLFVSRDNFYPKPKVESSVLLFESHNLYYEIDDTIFLNFIKKWFKEPRKKLMRNFLNSNYKKEDINQIFNELWLDENIRWEDLDINTWIKLCNKFNKK